MFEIGASLTAARESEGLSLGDAERLTNLRARYLEALERDDFDVLPGRAYARAFLRTYADALGLDADRLVAEFEERCPEPEAELPPPVYGRPQRRLPARGLLVGLVVLAGLGALAWSGFSTPSPTPSVAAPPHRAAVHHTLVAQHTQPPAPPKPQPLLIRAVRGECWVQVRRGGPTGPVVYEGTLAPGQALHYGPRVWVRLGAPWNVTVRRGAKAFPARSLTQPENLVA